MQSRKGQKTNYENTAEEEHVKIGEFVMESAGVGDQMLAIKPWVGAIKPPTNPPPFKNAEPTANLELEYVYGYRCFDTRKNVFYTSD